MTVFKNRLAIASIALASALVAAQPANAAAGLAGAYYDTVGITSLAQAASAISGKTPNVTFNATTICYPACHTTASDNTSLNAFLGSNATGISANSISNLAGHVMTLTGFLNITTAGTHSIWLRSDDGSSVTIDGVTLASDGVHSLSSVMQDFVLGVGQHAISVIQFENEGDTGLTLKMDGHELTGSQLTHNPVPEPATWAMMIGGFALAGAAMRRKAIPAVSFA